MQYIDNFTNKREARPVHKGAKIKIDDLSGMEWVTWKGVKYFVHYELMMLGVKREMEKGRTKEEVLDEMWEIFAEIPEEKH